MTKIFNELIGFLINTLLFVRIEQQKSGWSPDAVIQMCSLKTVLIEKNNKVGKVLEKNPWRSSFFVKLQALGLEIFEKWTPSQLFYKDFSKIISYPFIILF